MIVDPAPLTFGGTRDAGESGVTEFGVVAGREHAAATELLRRLDGGAEVSLCNNLDEGREGRTDFRKLAGGYETRTGGHGWQSPWGPTDRASVHAAVVRLAGLNRGGHWSTSGTLCGGERPVSRPNVRARAVYVVATLALIPVVVVWLLWLQSELWPQVWLWPFGSGWQFESAEAELSIIRPARGPAGPFPVGARFESYVLPYWLLLAAACAVAALPVAAAARAHRRENVVRQGRCPACEYDLTGNVSGVGPECGRARS
jgi:hypothetical protein